MWPVTQTGADRRITITMAKEYSEKSFLLEVDDYSLIADYLRNRKPSIVGFSYTKDKTKKRQNSEEIVERIIQNLREQPDEIQREIERDFKRISGLANEKGSQNLIAEAEVQKVQIPIDAFTEMNTHDRALWFFNTYPVVFDEADAIQQFYDLNGWKRVPVPNQPISVVAEKKDILKQALQKYYEDTDAVGKYGHIEVYDKKDRIYVVARLTKHAENNFVPDGLDGLKRDGTRRQTFEVYFLYRPTKDADEDGELEIKAAGGWEKQRDLLGVFTKTVFNFELDDSRQAYDLALLKKPTFTMIADPEDRLEWWWLKSLELCTPDRLTRIKVSVTDGGYSGVDAMWEELRRLHLADKVEHMLINWQVPHFLDTVSRFESTVLMI